MKVGSGLRHGTIVAEGQPEDVLPFLPLLEGGQEFGDRVLSLTADDEVDAGISVQGSRGIEGYMGPPIIVTMSGLCSLTAETICAAAGKFRVTDVPPTASAGRRQAGLSVFPACTADDIVEDPDFRSGPLKGGGNIADPEGGAGASSRDKAER